MGFSPEVIAQRQAQQERADRRSQWICEPGWHVVEIEDYRHTSGSSVEFFLRDDLGRKQTVPFSLSVPVLRTGELLRFVQAALHWPEWEGNPLNVATKENFRAVLDKRVDVLVFRDEAVKFDHRSGA